MLTRPLACAGLRPRARSARRWTSLEQLWCSAPEFQICKSFSSCATPTPRPPVVNAMAPAYKGPSVAVVGAGGRNEVRHYLSRCLDGVVAHTTPV